MPREDIEILIGAELTSQLIWSYWEAERKAQESCLAPHGAETEIDEASPRATSTVDLEIPF